MTKTQFTIAALSAIALAEGAYVMIDAKPVQVEIVAEPSSDAVVLATPPEIQAAIAEVARPGDPVVCDGCEVGVWDGSKRVLTKGWCCNGAFMPRPIALALDTAKAALAVPVEMPLGEEEIIKP